jgi:hypothetical protein
MLLGKTHQFHLMSMSMIILAQNLGKKWEERSGLTAPFWLALQLGQAADLVCPGLSGKQPGVINQSRVD